MFGHRASTRVSDAPGVDAHGEPVRDPTANVLDLVNAAVKRLDDLRTQEAAHAREVAEIRADYERERANIRDEFARQLRQATAELAAVRAASDERVRVAEAARLDAIRAVDIGAVQRANDVATATASTLAAQVAATAETLRTSVETAAKSTDAKLDVIATAADTKLDARLLPVIKDVDDLRQSMFTLAGGRAQVAETRDVRGGQQLTMGTVFGAVAATVAVISMLLVIMR